MIRPGVSEQRVNSPLTQPIASCFLPGRKLFITIVAAVVIIFLTINIIEEAQFEVSQSWFSFVAQGNDSMYTKENNSLSEVEDFKNLSILCLVMTRPDGDDLRKAVLETWGPGCTDLVFFIGDKNASKDVLLVLKPHIFLLILSVDDRYDNTWMKIRTAMKFVNTSWSEPFDWLLRIDDDAYVIFDNLRQCLASFDSSKPVQLGAHYAHYLDGYIGTGPGIAISRAAFHDLMQSFDNHSLCNTNAVTHNDDVELGM